jgi:hypothetical protein
MNSNPPPDYNITGQDYNRREHFKYSAPPIIDIHSRVTMTNPVANAEGQTGNPVGYAESVQQERQLASQGHGIPDWPVLRAGIVYRPWPSVQARDNLVIRWRPSNGRRVPADIPVLCAQAISAFLRRHTCRTGKPIDGKVAIDLIDNKPRMAKLFTVQQLLASLPSWIATSTHMDDFLQQCTAYHEAAHAVIYLLHGIEIEGITLFGLHGGGVCSYVEGIHPSYGWLLAILAGREADRMFSLAIRNYWWAASQGGKETSKERGKY